MVFCSIPFERKPGFIMKRFSTDLLKLLQILFADVEDGLVLVEFLFIVCAFGFTVVILVVILVAAGQHDEILPIRRDVKYGIQAAVTVGIAVMQDEIVIPGGPLPAAAIIVHEV